MQEIAVGTVDLYAIHACVNGVACGLPELIDDARHLFTIECSGHWALLTGFEISHRSAGGQRGGSCRLRSFKKAGMRQTPAIHYLHEDAPAGIVNGLRHATPPSYLLWCLDTRLAWEGTAGHRWEHTFCHDKPHGGALRVVPLVQLRGDTVATCARPGQSRHRHAVWKR